MGHDGGFGEALVVEGDLSELERVDLLRLTLRRWGWVIAGASAIVLAVDVAASLHIAARPRWLSLARIGAYSVAGVFAAVLLRRGRNGAVVLVCAWVVEAIGVGVVDRGLSGGVPGAPIVGMVAAMVTGWARPLPPPVEELPFAAQLPSLHGLAEVIAATGIGPVAAVAHLRLVDDRDARRGAYVRRRAFEAQRYDRRST
jgi:hypothetical protein